MSSRSTSTIPRDPEELSLSRALRLYGRAIRLRCAYCGGGPLRDRWMQMRRTCATCGIRTERGEEDFFLGAMMFNIVLSEGLLAVILVGVAVATWPAVPWNPIWIGGTVAMAAAPFLFYPFSHAIWLASDILIRPVTDEEMDWHRSNPTDAFRPSRDR